MHIAQRLSLIRGSWTILSFAAAASIWRVSAVAAEESRPEVQASAGFTADFAYYPYYNSARIRVDFTKLQDRATVKGIGLRIVRRGTGEALVERTLAAPGNFVGECEWRLPALGEGEYELIVHLNGTVAAERRVDFERHVFPWEHNSLGTSDAIVPPFAALVTRDDKVSTILRTHTVDQLGLWRQVNSLGLDLLKGPMRLELRRGNRTELMTAQSFGFSERSGTRVVTESTFPGGTTRGEWDYDGVMKWTLDLAPDPRPIDALTLVISLDDRLMPLMHACTDGIRFNYAGYVPTGEGRVWDGTEAKRRAMVGSYVPYIWIGAEERGLAVFGENDHGWVTAKAVPCQELRREGDTLELRLNLIVGPSVINERHRIILGFQATPTKPMPADWRLWSMGGSPIPGSSAKHFTFLGSCWSWGALTPCLDVYPRNEDFTLWDDFAQVRKTGRLEPAVLEAWLANIADLKSKETSRREVGYGFRAMSQKPQSVLVYTNARGFRGDTREGQTFLNEWDRLLFPKREWAPGNGPAFDLNPGESFRDYAVWHYRRMLKTFADAIYWDDTFLQSVFHPVGTEAYETQDGAFHPAAGLWDMRELVRRTAVLGVELGKPPTNMVHMTNAAIAPVLSFAQMLFTWEDKRHGSDFQDRFSRDYIRAESIGRQHGGVAFAKIIIENKDPALAAWERRTATGAMLVHEIKTLESMHEWWSAYEKLLAFGYGQAGVQVFNYWSTDNPVSVGGTDAATLTLTKPGSALVVICDYGNGGALTLSMPRGLPGLPDRFKARDLETGAPMEVTPDGLVHFTLQRHDFKLVGLEAEQSETGRFLDSGKG